MQVIRIPAGTKVFLGKPAKPMDESLVRAISALVSDIEGVLEAHLPQCYVAGVVDPPAQVLIMVIRSQQEAETVLYKIGVGLESILPPGVHLDVLPVSPSHPLLIAARKAECLIKRPDAPKKRPWWKFW